MGCCYTLIGVLVTEARFCYLPWLSRLPSGKPLFLPEVFCSIQHIHNCFYHSKIVMLQFFATWCTYCKAELPSVQELYEELPDDLVILVVNQPGGRETDKQGVIDFLDKNGYTFPTVFDEDGQVNYNYGITGLPTTYLINTEGNVYGYMPGAMDKQTMLQIIDMARNNEAY